jgi:hypothetical protein
VEVGPGSSRRTHTPTGGLQRPAMQASATPGTAAVQTTTATVAAATPTATVVPTATVAPTATEPTLTATSAPAVQAARATALPPTAEATVPSPAAPAGATVIIVDHEMLAAFDEIPAGALAAAGELRLLFRHASVGENINNGLNCLQNDLERRPNACDRGLAADEILFDPIYDRRNWTFELHSPPPNPNPGWWNKVGFFIERVNNLAPEEAYDVISFKLGYVDGLDNSDIAAVFFTENADGSSPAIPDIEALLAAHADKQLLFWTMGLARIVGTANSASFNEQLREYVRENGGILLDIADIESHSPDGSPCTHDGYPALCPDYTEESRGGHLNARGSQRLARALWLAMALLAGWNGS